MSAQSPAGGFARRLAHLRALLQQDFAEAGDQALKLLEEYLEQHALDAGYHQGPGGIARYANYLRGRAGISRELLEQAELYAQVRNCLAHSYGLQTSRALAEEIVAYLGGLISEETATAAQMMSSNLRSVAETTPLREARDIMLREGFSRLPVLRERRVCAGLLTDRDIVTAEAGVEARGGLLGAVTVGEVLGPGAARRFVVLPPDAAYAQVLEALKRASVEAVLVTNGGRKDQPPMGIITHADVLYRMGPGPTR